MRHLILAHRHQAGAVDENVGALQQRVAATLDGILLFGQAIARLLIFISFIVITLYLKINQLLKV
jgi:hypothetical protein